MGNLQTVEIWALKSMPEAELPTTMTFWNAALAQSLHNCRLSAAHLALVLRRVPVELGVGDSARVRFIKVGKTWDFGNERVVVVTAGDHYGIKLRFRCLIGLEVLHLNLPAYLATTLYLLQAQNLRRQ